LAAREYRSMVKHSNELEAFDYLQRAMEKSNTIKDFNDKVFDNEIYEASTTLMTDNRSGFILKISDGVYISGLTEVMGFCERYDIALPQKLIHIWESVFKIIRHLEDVIQLLDARVKMPYVKEKQPKTKRKKATTLQEACLGPAQYNAVKGWFIDEGLCDPVTMAWKNRKKGEKSFIVLCIKDLSEKGYTHDLQVDEIIAIVKNTFHFTVDEGTVIRPKGRIYNRIPFYVP